ncbi:MAG: hypothetical protein JW910_04090 [Anaerolineae bacterium]|nr:hypothetical protein [Anaerolineae bacterium]
MTDSDTSRKPKRKRDSYVMIERLIEGVERRGDLNIDPALARALGFTAHDLAANRDGYMSEAQRATLRRKRRDFVLEGIGGFVVFGLLGLVIIVAGLAAASEQREPLLGLLLVGAFVTLSLFVFWTPTRDTLRQARERWHDFQMDLDKRDVGRVSGTVRLEIEHQGRYTGFKLFIEGYEFAVSSEVLLAFKNGEPYHVYFAPLTLILLAAEPAAEPADFEIEEPV